MNHITDFYCFYEWPEVSSSEANLTKYKRKIGKIKRQNCEYVIVVIELN